MNKALHHGGFGFAKIPLEATTAVAMFEYFVDLIGFEGDLVDVNVRNTEYLRIAVKDALVSQVCFPLEVNRHFQH